MTMQRYFATVARGLEPLAAQELEALGAEQVSTQFTGVEFWGDRALLYRVNLWARTVFRVLMPIAEVSCRSAEDLYRDVQKLDWRDYLTPAHTLAVDCTGSNAALNHTHFTALQVKNAIVDQQRQRGGRRSDVDAQQPDLRLNLHIHKYTGVLSLDSSGSSLHRRGYRPAVGTAPLKETLAAALLAQIGWEGDRPLYDPCCGSGTIPLEAGLKALNIAPGLFRAQFGFETWQDFDADLWQQLRQEAAAQQRDRLAAPIIGSDRDLSTLQQAHSNAEYCGLDRLIEFQTEDILEMKPPCESGVLICNPPYGHRLGNESELVEFYRQLGDRLKQQFTGWTAYILTTKALGKQVGLKASQRLPVYNGSLACTFLRYDLY
ncbi:THUMP domain-containing protein [Spirulina major CS-329]|nr:MULTISPECIES: THUMP domain-containing protein [Spirulina]MDB9504397.1 THUMP domain-containing protein [Spirulina major CS-329]